MRLRCGRAKTAPDKTRFESLDGLRGYLAFFVFIHHGAVWFFYLKTGIWDVPPSKLYNQFGQASVGLFFMITAFLFSGKLLEAKRQGVAVDWGKLFVGRVRRIYPLYIFAGLLQFATVIWLTNGEIFNLPLRDFGAHFVNWATFDVAKLPAAPVAGPEVGANIILALVTWTLQYEALFYLSLPLLALFLRMRTPKVYWILGVVGFVVLLWLNFKLAYQSLFLGGIIAAFVGQLSIVRKIAPSKWASVAIVAALVYVFFYERMTYGSVTCFVLLTFAFTLIAAGNDLWGALVAAPSRLLGDISYSVYLLHGFVLFVTFRLLFGFEIAREFTAAMHWFVIACATPVLLILASLTYRFIERPFLKKSGARKTS